MTTTPEKSHILRSIWAVFAGVLANFILAMGIDAILHATGIYPRWMQPMAESLWAIALGYRIIISILGGYITARLAPSKPLKHVAILLAIGALLGILGVAANWGKGPEFGPIWFNLGIIITGIPCTWIGGLLFARRSVSRRS